MFIICIIYLCNMRLSLSLLSFTLIDISRENVHAIFNINSYILNDNYFFFDSCFEKEEINLPTSRLWWFLQSKYKLLAYVTPSSPQTGPPYISLLSKIVQFSYKAILSCKVSANTILLHIPISERLQIFFVLVCYNFLQNLHKIYIKYSFHLITNLS